MLWEENKMSKRWCEACGMERPCKCSNDEKSYSRYDLMPQIKSLEKQILKMRNCGNCRNCVPTGCLEDPDLCTGKYLLWKMRR